MIYTTTHHCSWKFFTTFPSSRSIWNKGNWRNSLWSWSIEYSLWSLRTWIFISFRWSTRYAIWSFWTNSNGLRISQEGSWTRTFSHTSGLFRWAESIFYRKSHCTRTFNSLHWHNLSVKNNYWKSEFWSKIRHESLSGYSDRRQPWIWSYWIFSPWSYSTSSDLRANRSNHLSFHWRSTRKKSLQMIWNAKIRWDHWKNSQRTHS